MARQATKAIQSVYCQARLEAAKWNEKLLTRVGAVEHLPGVTEDSLKKYELGITKVPHDVVLLMADAYNAPHLLNYYCLHECPIGHQRTLSDEVVELDRVTLKLLKRLRVDQLEEIKEKLVDIAEDGVISEEEKPDMAKIMDYLDELAKTISEIQTAGKRALNKFGGNDNGKET